MDELDQLWREINEKTKGAGNSIPALSPGFLPSAHNMLAEMMHKVRYKLWFIYAFTAVFGGWCCYAIATGVQRDIVLLIGAMFLFGLLNLWLVLPSYLRMKRKSVLMSDSSQEVLRFYYQQLRTIIRQENLVSALFSPFAAMLGFAYAIIEEKGSFSFILERNWLLLTMLVTGIIVGLLGAWTAVWMNRVAFGKYLKYLKENLEALEGKEVDEG